MSNGENQRRAAQTLDVRKYESTCEPTPLLGRWEQSVCEPTLSAHVGPKPRKLIERDQFTRVRLSVVNFKSNGTNLLAFSADTTVVKKTLSFSPILLHTAEIKEIMKPRMSETSRQHYKFISRSGKVITIMNLNDTLSRYYFGT